MEALKPDGETTRSASHKCRNHRAPTTIIDSGSCCGIRMPHGSIVLYISMLLAPSEMIHLYQSQLDPSNAIVEPGRQDRPGAQYQGFSNMIRVEASAWIGASRAAFCIPHSLENYQRAPESII